MKELFFGVEDLFKDPDSFAGVVNPLAGETDLVRLRGENFIGECTLLTFLDLVVPSKKFK